ERLVHQMVPVPYPRRGFRRWLRSSVTAAALTEPVELGGSQLAVSLDSWLGGSVTDWQDRPEHLSEALRLVEATYIAILRLADDRHGRELQEHWGRARN